MLPVSLDLNIQAAGIAVPQQLGLHRGRQAGVFQTLDQTRGIAFG